jgi:hypothetical protein
MSNHKTQIFQITTSPQRIFLDTKTSNVSNCIAEYKAELLQTSDLDNRLDRVVGVIKNLY